MKYMCFSRPGVYGKIEEDERPIIEDEGYIVGDHPGWRPSAFVVLPSGEAILPAGGRWGEAQELEKEDWMEKVKKERGDPGGMFMQYAILPLRDSDDEPTI